MLYIVISGLSLAVCLHKVQMNNRSFCFRRVKNRKINGFTGHRVRFNLRAYLLELLGCSNKRAFAVPLSWLVTWNNSAVTLCVYIAKLMVA